jgi:23S rRNA pseudouridine1911/1915/1917 synthase
MDPAGELPLNTTERGQDPGLGDAAEGELRASFDVPAAQSGERIDKVIAACVDALSRGRARKLLDKGAVFLGRKRCRVASRPVQVGDRITVTWREEPVEAPAAPLDVVFEDDHLAVIHKPVGQHSQGTALGDSGTVVRMVESRFGGAAQIAHRLDAPTSGLLLVGKTADTVARLRPMVREHALDRRYLALCSGAPTEGRCDNRLVREDRRTLVATGGDGKEAATWFDVLHQREGVVLVHARLETGRTHQVRVHLQSMGTPILGDRLYGGPRAPRLALHAWRLSLAHPVTGEALQWRRDPEPSFWEAARWEAIGLDAAAGLP